MSWGLSGPLPPGVATVNACFSEVSFRERRGAATTVTGDLRYTSCVDRDRLAQEIAQVFAARNEDAAAVYLFGSVARGQGRADSDVDVAVLYGKPVEPGLAGLRLGLAGDIEERLGRRVDLVVLDNQPPDLVHRVLRDGLLILENDRSARIRFEVTARNEYFDVLPTLRRYRRPRRVRAA